MTENDRDQESAGIRTVEVTSRPGDHPWVVTVAAAGPAGNPDILMRVAFTAEAWARRLQGRLTRRDEPAGPSDSSLDLMAFAVEREAREQPGTRVLEVDPRDRLYPPARAALAACDPLGDPASVARTAPDIRRHVIVLGGALGENTLGRALTGALTVPQTSVALAEYASALARAARHVGDHDRMSALLDSIATLCSDPGMRRRGQMAAFQAYEERADAATDPAAARRLLEQSRARWNDIPASSRRHVWQGARVLFKLGDDTACSRACADVAENASDDISVYNALHLRRMVDARAAGQVIVWEDNLPLLASEEDRTAWLDRLAPAGAGIPGDDASDALVAADELRNRLIGMEASGDADPAAVRQMRTTVRGAWGVVLRRLGGVPAAAAHGPIVALDACLIIARESAALGDLDTAYSAYGVLKDADPTDLEARYGREAIRASRVGATLESRDFWLQIKDSRQRALG